MKCFANAFDDEECSHEGIVSETLIAPYADATITSIATALSPDKRRNFSEWLARDVGNSGRFRGMADDEQQKWLFVRRAFEDAVQKRHWAGGVRERDETCVMNCRHQESGREADRFAGVVVLHARAIRLHAVRLRKDRDQPRRDLEKRLLRIGAEWRERRQPRGWCSMLVEFALFLFGCRADLVFHGRICDRDEVPGLQVRPARRTASRTEARLDDLAWNGTRGKFANGSASLHAFVERGGICS